MLLGNMLLALAWAALQGQFSLGTLGTGYLFGYLILPDWLAAAYWNRLPISAGSIESSVLRGTSSGILSARICVSHSMSRHLAIT